MISSSPEQEAACYAAVRDGCARPDDWFPERSMDRWNKAALDLCMGCGIREDCLGVALRRMERVSVDSVPGIWGGTTYEQRLGILRRKWRTR